MLRLKLEAFRRSRSAGNCKAFTLLELIIVLFVLAALAALVVPTLGYVRDQADHATAAAGAAEVLNNLEIYKASTGNYPNRLDTLVADGGSAYSKLYPIDSSGKFAYGDLSTGFEYYYLGNGGGMTEFMMHDESVEDANASTETAQATEGSSASFLVIDPEQVSPYYEAKMRRIVRAAYPNQSGGSTANDVAIPDGHSLVVLGVGSRASCIGTTMTSAPVHGGAEDGKYSRYIAVFDVWAGGTGRGSVQLKLVTDSEFEVIAKNISNYEATGPTDDEAIYTEPPTDTDDTDDTT